MRYLSIIFLSMVMASCAPRRDFVPVPNLDEIAEIIYTQKEPYGAQRWVLINDNLKVHQARLDKNGKAIKKKTIKTPKNTMNWFVTSLENANYQSVRVIPVRVSNTKARSATLVIKTLGETYTFVQKNNQRFPAGIARTTERFQDFLGAL